MAKEKKVKPLTPMMKQYFAIKENYPDTVLLYRMGDFFELFNDDAAIASEVLGLTLTARNHGGENETPLAGFPHHALDKYAHKLVKAGYKIAICEQVEDPKTAKGVVKRDVVEVISAGTGIDDTFLDEKANNYVLALFDADEYIGIALCDLTTGEFRTFEVEVTTLVEEIVRIDPAEIVLPTSRDESSLLQKVLSDLSAEVPFSFFDDHYFEYSRAEELLIEHFAVKSVEALGLEGRERALQSSGALLSYLRNQKKSDLKHIATLSIESRGGAAHLDPATIRNLELLRPLHTDVTGGTLISVMDKSATSLGTRKLKQWMVRPLTTIADIQARLAAVEWFKEELFIRADFENLLKSVSDLERVIGRITLGRAHGRDIASLRNSLRQFPAIITLLAESPSALVQGELTNLKGFEKLLTLIETQLVEEPPLALKDGGVIKDGFDDELDTLRDASQNGKEWIARLQATEREKTGIETLKVGYNRVFGYFLEVTKAQQSKVPESYIRKQTLVNAERYITPELKEMEATVLGAEEKLATLEYELFTQLRQEVAVYCRQVQEAANSIAILDVLQGLGRVALEQNYCRPTLTQSQDMTIVEGRHPVVEQMRGNDPFVPNDTTLIEGERQLLLITGPNMAGKSTYLRQNALIALMAQMGSFVPASEASIGVVDKFFTRIGASDRLARGQSTFLVEMIEVANILNNATDSSLVLLDEVGRGTSTFDGVSIAWAVAEYLHNTKGCAPRTFFATHYHELTELSTLLPRVANLHIQVKEWNDTIVFLRKIVEGGSSHSYGIQVAGLAGVPSAVIDRAQEILGNLENQEFTSEHMPKLALHTNPSSYDQRPQETPAKVAEVQLSMFDSGDHPVLMALKDTDIYGMTPLEALNFLASLKEKL